MVITGAELAELTVRVKFWVALGEIPLVAVKVRGYEPVVPEAGVPFKVAVLLVKVTPPGSDPLEVIVGVGLPVAVTVKEQTAPTNIVVWLELVMVGALPELLTVKVADSVVTEPALLVKIARYCFPLSLEATVKVKEEEVAPLIFVQAPLTGKTCHWTIGVGVPEAAVAKVAVPPAVTVWFAGWVVTTGPAPSGLTVKVAALVVAEPELLVKTTRYR
jgi:hypothetical protein